MTKNNLFAVLEEIFYEMWHPSHGTNMTDMNVHFIRQLLAVAKAAKAMFY